MSHESNPSSVDRLVSRVLDSMDTGRFEALLLMSLLFDVIGRTTWDMEDLKEAFESEPARDRPVDDRGVFDDSIEERPRYSDPGTSPLLGQASCNSDVGSGADSGWNDWTCCFRSLR